MVANDESWMLLSMNVKTSALKEFGKSTIEFYSFSLFDTSAIAALSLGQEFENYNIARSSSYQ